MNQVFISRKELIELIGNDYPKMKKGTIEAYISKLKTQGVLESPSRSIYTLKDQSAQSRSSKEQLFPAMGTD